MVVLALGAVERFYRRWRGAAASVTRRRAAFALKVVAFAALLAVLIFFPLVYLPSLERIGAWADNRALNALFQHCSIDGAALRATRDRMFGELAQWLEALIGLAVLSLPLFFISWRIARHSPRAVYRDGGH
jgi:type VI protein secretion system component VasF